MKQGSVRLLGGLVVAALVLGAGIWIGRKSGQIVAAKQETPSETSSLLKAVDSAAPAETPRPSATPVSPATAAAAPVSPSAPPVPALTASPSAAASVIAAAQAQTPEEKMNATALDQYFRALNDANSAVYEVKAGDNLTRIAKQFGVMPGLIQAANRLKNDRIFPGQKLRVPKARWSLLVNKDQNMLYLEADGTAVRSYRIATGKDRSTPEGTFKILNHLKNPTWYYDGKVVPPDSPDNPLGTRWMGFDKEGYGLHGTSKPEEIGQFATLGCVRMLNEDIETLFEILPVGTEVTVVAQRV